MPDIEKKTAFIQFIKLHLGGNDPFSDLANDIRDDQNFPIEKSYGDITAYMDMVTGIGRANDVFKEFLIRFNKWYMDKGTIDIRENMESLLTVFASENWDYFKNTFQVGSVYLIGNPTDYYKAYLVEKSNKNSILIDLKFKPQLNDIKLVDEEKIHKGPKTRNFTVGEAIVALENCTYDNGAMKPDQSIFRETLAMLRQNLDGSE